MSDAHARATPRGTLKDYPALHHRVTASPHDSGVGMAIGKMPPAVPGGRVSPELPQHWGAAGYRS
jgi:hypothetical protein